MTPNFRATNEALYHTLYYFRIDRIATHIKKLGGEPNLSYLDSYNNVTFHSHKEMEEEINQNIFGSNNFIKLSLFEYLRDWLNSWQFNDGFENEIEYLIDIENKKELFRYKEEIKIDEAEFRKNIPPGLAEGEEYEVKINKWFNPLTKQNVPERIVKKINKFITEKKPDLIDKDYLPQYLGMLKRIIDSFRIHSEKYVINYFDGKYPDPVNLVQHPFIQKELPPIELSIPEIAKKLTVDLSVPQLVVLFCMLREMNIISEPVNTQLARFIKANFSTKGSKDISEKTIVNLISSLDTGAIDHWLDNIKQMRITLANLKG